MLAQLLIIMFIQVTWEYVEIALGFNIYREVGR